MDLAAGSQRDRAELDQNHRVGRQFVLGDHPPSHGVDHVAPLPAALPLRFANDDQPLLSAQFDGESGGPAIDQPFAGFLDGPLNVLRITIHAANDDQVFQTTSDEQFAVEQEAQVAGPQVAWTFRIHAGAERFLGGCGVLPIPLGDTAAANPDLTHFALGRFPQRLGVDNSHLGLGQHLPATHQLANGWGVGDRGIGGRSVPRLGHAVIQLLGVEPANDGPRECVASGHDERGFRHAVARVHGFRPKSRRPKAFDELLDHIRPHRFGAVERHQPGAQVQSLQFLVADLVGA